MRLLVALGAGAGAAVAVGALWASALILYERNQLVVPIAAGLAVFVAVVVIDVLTEMNTPAG